MYCSSDVRSLYLLIGVFVCSAFDMSVLLQFVIRPENTCTSHIVFGYEIGTKKCDIYTSNYGRWTFHFDNYLIVKSLNVHL